MAVVAAGKAQPSEIDQALPCSCSVGTFDAGVFARKRITGSAMIEARRWLPGLLGMAAGAIGAELAIVDVLVADGASGWQAQKRAVQVLHLDLARLHANQLGFVAVLAHQRGMLALQRKTSQGGVIEAGAIEPRNVGAAPVVFAVAAGTIQLIFRGLVSVGVKPLFPDTRRAISV